MKVVLFSTQWPEYLISLANGMSKRCDTILVIPENNNFSARHKQLVDRKVTLITYQVVLYKSIRDNFKMLFRIIKILWKYKPEILHVQSNGHRLFYWVALFKPYKTNIVNTIHDPVKHSGDIPSLRISDKIVKYALKMFTKKYIVHGASLVDVLTSSYSISKNRITSINHGNFNIYMDFMTEHVDEEPNTILFFGRIWEYKGLKYFIEAANIVNRKHKEAKFIIAGVGESLEKYTRLIENIDSFEIINKKIEIDEVGLLFQKSCMVVLPYIDASQSGVIPLAYSFKKPVIVTSVGGLPDVVENNKTGYIVQPKSANSIALKMLLLLENEGKRKEMGTNAYNYANSELSWEKIAKETYHLYTEVLN